MQNVSAADSIHTMNLYRDQVKPALDVALAGALLPLALPLMALAGIAVWLTMGRPVLFVQYRPGLQGRPFRLFKFRTMRQPAGGRIDASTDGQRLTRVGKVLRATSVDELPSLMNVVRGEMSLVGPRPLLLSYMERYTREQLRRHDVRPGVTGWAQVQGRNDTSWAERFERDLWYVEHESAGLDLRILALTVARVLSRRGVSQPGSATMEEFFGE